MAHETRGAGTSRLPRAAPGRARHLRLLVRGGCVRALARSAVAVGTRAGGGADRARGRMGMDLELVLAVPRVPLVPVRRVFRSVVWDASRPAGWFLGNRARAFAS